MKDYEIAAGILPSERQVEWQKMEFYAFCHFGMNTFTNAEWGDGTTPAERFNPTDFDAVQWAKVIKSAGMTGLILTCKHHDGFCLWPSQYTEYSVKNSPFKDGKGDIVKEVSDACLKEGLKFGVYLSPWDRHEESYGKGKEYDTYYKNQITELLTNYGDIFSVWFDGACGEGPNGKVQKYDWQSYYALIRELQPNAVINVSGPDVRWIGNEAGVCRKEEWSVVPSFLYDNDDTAEKSQKDEKQNMKKKKNTMSLDLGSRKSIKGETSFRWYPAEVDVSIRPGWFYHEKEDYKVKSLEKLYSIYLASVGGNAALLLNIPPDKRGQIAMPDALLLERFGRYLHRQFGNNLMSSARASASSEIDSEHLAKNILSDDETLFWQAAADDELPEIVIDLGCETQLDKIVLKENIRTGQQIESFQIYYEKNNKWKKLYKGTVIGYKKICILKRKRTVRRIKIVITNYRVKATLLKAEAYIEQD